jgi:predicted DNA-binding transcriptional regulator AlpA
MQQFTFLTRDDVKTAVLEALSESQFLKTSAPEPEVYIYGLQNLAKFLGIGVTTAWSLKKQGRLPYYQAGKKLYFKKSEIEAVTANRIG